MEVRVITIPHSVQACQLLVAFLQMLSCSQFVHKITAGEAGEEIWSSVKYLFFSSTSLIYRKHQQDRQGIMCSKDLKGVLGLEISRAWGPWFNVSDKRASAESCLQGYSSICLASSQFFCFILEEYILTLSLIK